ncbi:hypothetical protein [Oleidesulfovibrio alaskensis]|uniref:hypothetical protein n=1 Tax=Oleidesulfovibrio alaskensis TaxID=58180 RepID=UPI00030D09AF|nr:hypothetical protein [Oleidesulfovibrio alaskensis]
MADMMRTVPYAGAKDSNSTGAEPVHAADNTLPSPAFPPTGNRVRGLAARTPQPPAPGRY